MRTQWKEQGEEKKYTLTLPLNLCLSTYAFWYHVWAPWNFVSQFLVNKFANVFLDCIRQTLFSPLAWSSWWVKRILEICALLYHLWCIISFIWAIQATLSSYIIVWLSLPDIILQVVLTWLVNDPSQTYPRPASCNAINYAWFDNVATKNAMNFWFLHT